MHCYTSSQCVLFQSLNIALQYYCCNTLLLHLYYFCTSLQRTLHCNDEEFVAHPCTRHRMKLHFAFQASLRCSCLFSTEISALCQVEYLYFSTACNAVYVVYLVRCYSLECSLYFAWLEMWFCQRWEILERLWVGNSCSTLTVGRRWAEKEHLLMENIFNTFCSSAEKRSFAYKRENSSLDLKTTSSFSMFTALPVGAIDGADNDNRNGSSWKRVLL